MQVEYKNMSTVMQHQASQQQVSQHSGGSQQNRIERKPTSTSFKSHISQQPGMLQQNQTPMSSQHQHQQQQMFASQMQMTPSQHGMLMQQQQQQQYSNNNNMNG